MPLATLTRYRSSCLWRADNRSRELIVRSRLRGYAKSFSLFQECGTQRRFILVRSSEALDNRSSAEPLEAIGSSRDSRWISTSTSVTSAMLAQLTTSALRTDQYHGLCVNRSDDNMLDVCFQESQLTSDPTTTPQQCNKGDRQRCQSS